MGRYYAFAVFRSTMADPNTGRFNNEDVLKGEIDDPLSLNLYEDVKNNPMIYVDPSSHKKEMVAGGGGGISPISRITFTIP